ncbi:MAG: exo-beta-N-acetylmuramidase NamZ domain-containing protein, partial [Methyloceanibacter sp.]
MLLGSERLLASSRLDGLKVGILANPASIDHNFTHIVDRLTASTSFKLGAIFGPQHGFRSDL